jgi:hypothetical protein
MLARVLLIINMISLCYWFPKSKDLNLSLKTLLELRHTFDMF